MSWRSRGPGENVAALSEPALARGLRELGIPAAAMPAMTEPAARDRLSATNPRSDTAADDGSPAIGTIGWPS